MTIAVAIRTGTAAVFAADSKVTTQGLAGFDAKGDPQWVPQTFDNAVKVVHDVPGVAGYNEIFRRVNPVNQTDEILRKAQEQVLKYREQLVKGKVRLSPEQTTLPVRQKGEEETRPQPQPQQ